MGKFALYTIGFALLACVPAILLAGMFSGGRGDVAPFCWGCWRWEPFWRGAVCLKDKLDRMEETLKAVSTKEVKTELETVKGRQEVAEIKLDTWRRSWGSTGRIEKTQTQMIFKKGEANMSIVIGSMILCVIGTFIPDVDLQYADG